MRGRRRSQSESCLVAEAFGVLTIRGENFIEDFAHGMDGFCLWEFGDLGCWRAMASKSSIFTFSDHRFRLA